MRIFPSAFAAFLGTVLLNQCAWFREDLATGTPRAFATPLLALFLAALSFDHWLMLTISLVLEGLFYPPMFLMSVVTWFLYLVLRKEFSVHNRQTYRFILACAIASVTLIPYLLPNSVLGPGLTMADAQQMPWFLPNAKNHFFSEPFSYYLTSTHTGFIPRLLPPTLWLAALLPVSYFRKPSAGLRLLICLVVASIILFVAAHLLLFRLYLPSRYPRYALQIAVPICSGIVIATTFQWIYESAQRKPVRVAVQLLGICLTIFILCVPFLWYRMFPRSQYSVGEQPELYEFFQKQPFDTLIASLSEEVNNLPAFSSKSILIGYEYSQIWHKNYYWQFQHRFSDTIQMQYSQDPEVVRNFIRKYDVDFILLDQTWLKKDYLKNQEWAPEFAAEVKQAEKNRRTHSDLFVVRAIPACTVFESTKSKVLDTKCVLNLVSPIGNAQQKY